MARSDNEEEYFSSSVEEKEEDEDEYQEEEEDEKDREEEERHQLEEGFYIVEAIRKRKVYKGQLQYLIKWRGWSESSNSWEPVENLGGVSDMIEAFENERMQSGRSCQKGRRSRRRGRGRQIASSSRAYMKQPQQLEATPHRPRVDTACVPHINRDVERGNTQDYGDLEENHPNEDSTNVVVTNILMRGILPERPDSGDLEMNHHNKNSTNVATPYILPIEEVNDGVPYHAVPIPGPTHMQVEPRTPNPEPAEPVHRTEIVPDHVVQIPGAARMLVEPRRPNPEPAEPVHLTDVVPNVVPIPCAARVPVEPSQPNLDPAEPVRLTGAKKRKARNVTRFLQGLRLVENESTGQENNIINNLNAEPANPSVVTKIIRAVDLTTSIIDNQPEVSVTFLANRSDGTIVYVDNKTLKAENPQLLFSYYERHLCLM